MSKNTFILFFTIALTFPVFAQNPIFKVIGKVIDDQTKLPLNNVSVQINGTLQGTITDSNGLFELSYGEKGIILTFSFIGYEKKFIKLNENSNTELTITLSQKTEILKEVVISSSLIETVIKSNHSNVLDYSFYDDNILLITFTNNLSNSKLILISQTLDTLSKIDIPGKPSWLFKDCLGNNHIVCDKYVYQVYFDSTNLHLLPPTSIQTFETLLFPCIAQDSANLYFIKKFGSHKMEAEGFIIKTHNHTLNYYYINKLDKKRSTLIAIEDQKTLKLKEEEDSFEEMKIALGARGTGRLFAETILFKEIYAPLFVLNDTIFIFDYVNSKIQLYSSGKMTKELEINFHNAKNWKREMCVDEKQHKAYAIFESNGITELKEINLSNGLLTNAYQIPFHFIEGIKAHDNYIYFLYRGKEYTDTKFLSRLRIN